MALIRIQEPVKFENYHDIETISGGLEGSLSDSIHFKVKGVRDNKFLELEDFDTNKYDEEKSFVCVTGMLPTVHVHLFAK